LIFEQRLLGGILGFARFDPAQAKIKRIRRFCSFFRQSKAGE
jgi:hypothetical protein